jgi:hypothetical protein
MLNEKIIWEWNLPPDVTTTLMLPQGAEVLDVVETNTGSVTMYVLCRKNVPLLPRHFAIFKAGVVIPETPMRFIKTFLVNHGSLVFHAFEVVNNTLVTPQGINA